MIADLLAAWVRCRSRLLQSSFQLIAAEIGAAPSIDLVCQDRGRGLAPVARSARPRRFDPVAIMGLTAEPTTSLHTISNAPGDTTI